MLIQNDKIPEGTPIFYMVIILSMVGTFDIVSEILDNNVETFSENLTKKIILWVAIYSQTKSVYYSSLVAICVVLMFPQVFFGKKSGPRLEKIHNLK